MTLPCEHAFIYIVNVFVWEAAALKKLARLQLSEFFLLGSKSHICLTIADFNFDESNFPNIVDTTFVKAHHIHCRPLRPESRKPALRRPLSSVSVDGVLTTDSDGNGGARVKRVKVLTEEQRQAIQNLTDPSQMTHAERKRQFGALNRRLSNSETLPAGVLAKWEAAKTQSQK